MKKIMLVVSLVIIMMSSCKKENDYNFIQTVVYTFSDYHDILASKSFMKDNITKDEVKYICDSLTYKQTWGGPHNEIATSTCVALKQ